MPKPQKPATEVVAKPENDRRQRRKFSEDEKARIVAEADACTERGQLGQLLRREGIYSSHLSEWRKKRKARGREGLAPQRPGPKPSQTEAERTIARLEREKAKLEKEVRIQRKLLELSGK